jgi:5-methylcytosine-specific restriction endonuclease McrA
MITQSQYQAYLATPYWREVSRLVKKRYGWRCGVCNSPLALQAHHRTYEHQGDELNHLDDLICLCKVCHKLFHSEQRKKAKKSGARLAYTINRPRKKREIRKPR